jgi:NADPH:quinone reductase-like Zn-dependent oxidoreductase
MGAGFFKPKNPIPGTDMAGVVEEVGNDVTRFQPGDGVFGETIGSMQWVNGGAYAEYVAVAEECLALKPGNVTFEQAASVPTSGYIALLNFGEVEQLGPGKRVLVNGAGGGVGALALQLAKAYGARVTAVDSTKKLSLLRELGADEVIDYTREDFTKGGVRYDLIFDIPGNHPFSECRRALTPEGRYILIGHEKFGESGKRMLGLIPHFFKLMFLSLFVKQLPKPNFSMPSKKDTITVFREFLEAGKITPIIDRTYPLSEASEAIRYLMEGEPQGRVIITP